MKNRNLTRRAFVRTAAGSVGAAAGIAIPRPFIGRVCAAETLTVADWGSPWIEYEKRAAEKWGKAEFSWVLHAGGAASVLPKIKAAWPNPLYDMADVWGPVFNSFIREGWAASVTLKDVPNLSKIPEVLISKDDKGNWKNVPRGLGGDFWLYRNDTCPFKLTKIDDLLDPRLKGQILWPNPTLNTNLQVIALAAARGGDERNIEPGWQFLKEIAKAGNIGRVSANTSDVINSLTTGETSVTFADSGTMSGAKGIQYTPLTKTDPSFKTYLYVSGWVLLENSKQKELALDFINFTLNKDSQESYTKEVGEAPINPEAKSGVEFLKFEKDEFGKFAINPDYEYVSSQVDEWNKRFEKEIVPLL